MGCNCGGQSRVAYAVITKDGQYAPGSPFTSSIDAQRVVKSLGPGARMKPVAKPPERAQSGPRR